MDVTIELKGTVFTDTDQIGVYAVFAEDSLYGRFVVNLLDVTESELLFSNTNLNSQEQENREDLLQPITREVWQWTALFAVCLLLCEWWFYHRT